MMSTLLLALWVALAGADRIDLSGGQAPFALTPFLVLTPMVAMSEFIRHHLMARPLQVSRQAIGYAAVCAAMLSVVFLSVLLAWQVPVSAARAFLLLAQIAGTFTVAVLCADRPDLARVLARGAIAGLAVFAVFEVAQVLWWLGRGAATWRVGPVLMHFDNWNAVGVFPRLSGPVGDPNRSGFVLLFYGVAIASGVKRGGGRLAAMACVIFFMVMTISRSTVLAATATGLMTVLTHRHAVSGRLVAATVLVMALAAGVLLVQPRRLDDVASFVRSPLAQRLSIHEGSAQSHVALLARGLNEATASVPRAAIGLGYGNSYLVLQDMFPGDRYGNFHSLYVTFFAEAGVVALLLLLVLMGTPMLFAGPWRPLVAGALAFNVFYQTSTEPLFWFVLAMAWLTRVGREKEMR